MSVQLELFPEDTFILRKKIFASKQKVLSLNIKRSVICFELSKLKLFSKDAQRNINVDYRLEYKFSDDYGCVISSIDKLINKLVCEIKKLDVEYFEEKRKCTELHEMLDSRDARLYV